MSADIFPSRDFYTRLGFHDGGGLHGDYFEYTFSPQREACITVASGDDGHEYPAADRPVLINLYDDYGNPSLIGVDRNNQLLLEVLLKALIEFGNQTPSIDSGAVASSGQTPA